MMNQRISRYHSFRVFLVVSVSWCYYVSSFLLHQHHILPATTKQQRYHQLYRHRHHQQQQQHRHHLTSWRLFQSNKMDDMDMYFDADYEDEDGDGDDASQTQMRRKGRVKELPPTSSCSSTRSSVNSSSNTNTNIKINTRSASQLQAALVEYKQIHGHLQVPREYIVPTDDHRFSPASRGAPLGKFVEDILFHFYDSTGDSEHNHKEELTAAGFDYDEHWLEFQVIKRALEAYKDIHGNLEVPFEFVVDEEDTRYPRRIRGKNLGYMVSKIEMLDAFREFRKEFLDLGLEFSIEPLPFHVFKEAFQRYQEVFGTSAVPKDYLIGWEDGRFPEDTQGIPLYKYVECIRTGHIYAEYRNELASIGFDFAETKIDFHLLKKCLLAYKQIHGHVNVPWNFRIPLGDNKFPVAAHGVDLGNLVRNIFDKHYYGEHREELISMGFDFSVKKDIDFNGMREALQTYKQIYGDLNVPLTFTIAEDDHRFPASLRGKQFVRKVEQIRRLQLFRMHREELLAMGFTFYAPPSLKPYEMFKTALWRYKEIYDTYWVPLSFVIPDGDMMFPKDVHGLKLGKYVEFVRTGHIYSEYKSDLESIGFEFDKKRVTLDVIQKAMVVYRKLHGNMSVPVNFVVPINDMNYPFPARGLHLGRLVHNPNETFQVQLAAMGLDYTKDNFPLVKDALLIYKQIYGDLLYLPEDLIIASNDSRYPEAVRGMKLGKIVKNIRKEGAFAQYKEDLRAIGFDFDEVHLGFPIIRVSLVIFQGIHGHLNVPDSYVIPMNDKRFPSAIRGRDLGRRIARIRNLDDYTEHYSKLSDLGLTFTFNPQPFKVFKKALLTYKEKYGSFDVPYKYVVPDEHGMDPELRGFQLQKHVDCIRVGYIYRENRKELISMGFSFHMKSNMELVEEALQAFYQIHGHLKIPQDFTIPVNDTTFPGDVRGIKLGDVVNKLRTQEKLDLISPRFRSLGCSNINDNGRKEPKFEDLERALMVYKKIHGHLRIPKSYAIPPDDIRYPEMLRGRDLGIHIDKMRRLDSHRDQRKKLENLGLEFTFQPRPFEMIKSALLRCKELFGRCDIPQDFCVEVNDDRFPEEFRGLELGKYVDCVKTGHIYHTYKEELKALGLEYNIEGEFLMVKEMLLYYQQFLGPHFPAKSVYIGNDNPSYPPYMHGQPLGRLARKFYFHPNYKSQIIALGFIYDVRFDDYELLISALSAYKAIHGDLAIPIEYYIPSSDVRYPEAARNLRLGYFFFLVRAHGYHSKYAADLRAMGVKFSTDDYVHFHVIKAGLEAYKNHYGNLDIPSTFIVPLNDTSYPLRLRGTDFGKKIARIRKCDMFRTRRKELQELGITFTFKPKDFSVFVAAVEAFQALNGKVAIPRNFVIGLNDTRYPEITRGLPLGKYVGCAYEGYFYAEHQQKIAEMGVFVPYNKRSHHETKTVPVELRDDYLRPILPKNSPCEVDDTTSSSLRDDKHFLQQQKQRRAVTRQQLPCYPTVFTYDQPYV